MAVRVLLVDDDALVRAGLRTILSAANDLDVVGEVDDGDGVVAAVRETRADVVLMDIRMPRVDGITATAVVRAMPDPPQVVVLTTFHADDHVLGALRAGAAGFLLKDTAPAQIIEAVRIVHAGEAMLSPAVTRSVLELVADTSADERRTAAEHRLAALTEREREVAVVVAAGASNAEVATRLFMSEATVKAHMSRLLTKLGAANRVQVAITVHDAGLV